MAVERTFHCDGPDCERHVRTRQESPPLFLTVTRDVDPDLHFCGWDCVLRYAGQIEPVMPEEVHTAHFYGGPWDGEVKDLRPFVSTVLVPQGTMGVYRHAYAMGSSNPAECRDHVFRYAGERER